MENRFQEFCIKYDPYFNAVVGKFPISPAVAQIISYRLTKNNPGLLKANNFFAIADGKTKVFKRFSTPWDGIKEGVQKIVQDPKFQENKVGTLRANPSKQLQKISLILGLST